MDDIKGTLSITVNYPLPVGVSTCPFFWNLWSTAM